mgnify:FL=1
MRHGFVFESETDTEVIPKLAKFVHDSLKEDLDNNGKGNLKALCSFKAVFRNMNNICPLSFVDKKFVPFTEVVMEVMRQLEGAYALIFKSPYYPNELVACKRGSPLLLGVKVKYLINIKPNHIQ